MVLIMNATSLGRTSAERLAARDAIVGYTDTGPPMSCATSTAFNARSGGSASATRSRTQARSAGRPSSAGRSPGNVSAQRVLRAGARASSRGTQGSRWAVWARRRSARRRVARSARARRPQPVHRRRPPLQPLRTARIPFVTSLAGRAVRDLRQRG
jgi:hypothetical protein